MEKKQESAGIVLLKFTPIIVFAALVIFSGLDLLIAAPIATFYAILIAMYVHRRNFSKVFDIAVNSAKEIMIVFFILMFAYGVAECFMATGTGASIINAALGLGVSARTVALVGYLVTCVLSIATGTSWGTFAACAPVFLWLNHIVGGNVILTLGSIAGGACFGDNIGLISDTTVLSSGLQGVEIVRRVRHQGVWSLICVVLSAVLILAFSMGLPNTVGNPRDAIAAIPAEAFEALAEERPSALALLEQVEAGVPMYMMIPLFIVIGLAVAAVPTMLCLGSGMVSCLILGLVAGTVTLDQWLNDLLLVGFGDAGGWSIVMMIWVSAFGGIMNSMEAFAPLAKLIVRWSSKVRHLMFWNAVLAMLGNVALADEAAEIATISPIIRGITEENVEGSEEDMYTLRLRLATFTDAMGVYSSQLIPWHCFPVFYVAIANAVYPLQTFVTTDIITYNFMAFTAVGSMLLLTYTGWDRFIPLFKLPSEPAVRLKKKVTAK